MKISFCTACMDRLFHLRETYANNIEKIGSNDAEFILLDYGGSDGVKDWVEQNNLPVKFYRTSAPRYWVASHAKNLTHRLASGDILCNLDCDVMIPEGFSDYLISSLSSGDCIVAASERDKYGNYGCAGLVAVLKDHFLSVNGYDENMNLGWSFESSNFVFRACSMNYLKIEVPGDITCIGHHDDERTARCQLKDILFTSEMSKRISDDMADSKIYKANMNREWGLVSDIQVA